MIIRELTPELAVADQLTLDDLEAVKEAGFKAVVCNRPDEEVSRMPKPMPWLKKPMH